MEPKLALAFSISQNPKGYALLLGSGISRSAGIPTGWEVTEDLIRKVAALAKNDCGTNPDEWFRTKYGKNPSYSNLLEELSPSPMDRKNILRPYFEATEDDTAQNLKQPTNAHLAIARLVQKGFINVILSTNFDRLMERALDYVGAPYVTISSSSAAQGCSALHQNPCTLIKVHGDYLDANIRNTVEELDEYDKHLNKLIDKVLDEYGLVICGWSAEWDGALRKAIERNRNRAFTTYWATRGEQTVAAKELIKNRRAINLLIKDADTLFQELEDDIQSISKFSLQHPLSARVAVETLKRLLPDESKRIRLFDLVELETRTALERTAMLPIPSGTINADDVEKFMKQCESAVDVLSNLFVNGGFWSRRQHSEIWVRSLKMVANANSSENSGWKEFRFYPALILFYCGGIASSKRLDNGVFCDMVYEPTIKEYGETERLFYKLNCYKVFEGRVQKMIKGHEKNHFPLSEYLIGLLKGRFESIMSADEYEDAFDRFEYLRNLFEFDSRLPTERDKWDSTFMPWSPGRYMWKLAGRGIKVFDFVQEEIDSLGSTWPPIAQGRFRGTLQRCKEVKDFFDKEFVVKHSGRYF